jgi:hypothetical protein
MTPVENSKIDQFWNWFSSNSETLEAHLCEAQEEMLAYLISPRVDELSEKVGWEIGPGVKKEFSFSLTFKGSRDVIPLVEKIVSRAPSLSDWEFNCGRPPKSWDGRFSLRDKAGGVIELDCSDWTYTLLAFDGNKFFDITFIGNLPPMDRRSSRQACNVVVQAQLGEREALELIDRVEINAVPTEHQLKTATPIRFLKKHIQSLQK